MFRSLSNAWTRTARSGLPSARHTHLWRRTSEAAEVCLSFESRVHRRRDARIQLTRRPQVIFLLKHKYRFCGNFIKRVGICFCLGNADVRNRGVEYL
jgi:hypothetical protein